MHWGVFSGIIASETSPSQEIDGSKPDPWRRELIPACPNSPLRGDPARPPDEIGYIAAVDSAGGLGMPNTVSGSTAPPGLRCTRPPCPATQTAHFQSGGTWRRTPERTFGRTTDQRQHGPVGTDSPSNVCLYPRAAVLFEEVGDPSGLEVGLPPLLGHQF